MRDAEIRYFGRSAIRSGGNELPIVTVAVRYRSRHVLAGTWHRFSARGEEQAKKVNCSVDGPRRRQLGGAQWAQSSEVKQKMSCLRTARRRAE